MQKVIEMDKQGKFAINIGGQTFHRPDWIGDANKPFDSRDDAFDWLTEMFCHVDDSMGEIIKVDGSYSEIVIEHENGGTITHHSTIVKGSPR